MKFGVCLKITVFYFDNRNSKSNARTFDIVFDTPDGLHQVYDYRLRHYMYGDPTASHEHGLRAVS